MKLIYSIFVFVALITASCVDPYQLETNSFEEVLVIEATLTNELKQHQVKITKTYKLEEAVPSIATNANVSVIDNLGNSYNYSFANGVYLSNEIYQAEANRSYKLRVENNGQIYESALETLNESKPIESITTTIETKNGDRGVQLRVNSFDANGNSKYYRFDYEETYKIIAPYWSENVATVILDDSPGMSTGDEIVISPRTYEARTCYSSVKSTELIGTSTIGLSEDRIQEFPIRFIKVTDPIIKHRYSINVKQYVQSLAAYTFYKTLAELSAAGENIFSQNQPGFFYGNIKSVAAPAEKVIGFFEVSGMSEKRIFFNFEDVFPNDNPPPYFYPCEIYQYNSTVFGPGDNQGANLRSALFSGTGIFYSSNFPIYSLVKPECGDCTTFSSNVIPPFWE